MDNAGSRQVVESCAADLPSVYQYVVVTGGSGGDTQPTKHQQNHAHETVEHRPYLGVGGDVRQHHIAAVGIHAATATLAAKNLDAMLTAVVQIHLILKLLVAPDDDCRLHLP